ncbi:hypothetical protein C8R42DRAFT_729753 [Lentinula raphanica]|nr:hypothetical protein C8R42DRAFT_729753 [Lentinula raphanica]
MADYHTMFQSFADFFEELPAVSEPMKVTTTVECSSESVCAAETFISTPNNELNPALVGIAVVVATAILFWPTSRAIRKIPPAMKRSHSPGKLADGARYSKVKIVPQASPESQESQSILSQLLEENQALHAEITRRDLAKEKAGQDLAKKHQELDDCITEVLNWVPKTIFLAHNKLDVAHRLLRKTNLELMNCQTKLKMPISLNLLDELNSLDSNYTEQRIDVTDANLILIRDLLQSKTSYEQNTATLQTRVAFLEEQLMKLEAKQASGAHQQVNSENGYSGGKDGVCDRSDFGSGTIKNISGYETQTSMTLNEESAEDGLPPTHKSTALASSLGEDLSVSVVHTDQTVENVFDEPSLGAVTITQVQDPKHVLSTERTLQIPHEAAGIKWFSDAFHFLNIGLGSRYIALLSLWVELERMHGWQTTRINLPKSHRPLEFDTWIRYGRYEFCAWWAFLQPNWRTFGEDKRPLPIIQFEDDWKSLDYFGVNGWFSLLAGIKWWGESLKQADDSGWNEELREWEFIIEDMAKMLDGLISYKKTHATSSN